MPTYRSVGIGGKVRGYLTHAYAPARDAGLQKSTCTQRRIRLCASTLERRLGLVRVIPRDKRRAAGTGVRMIALAKERRRSFRVPVPATAFLWRHGRFAGGYPVSDISIGGCSIKQGPFCVLGQRYEITLQVDTGSQSANLQCPAQVVRRSGDTLGLRFVDTNAGDEDRIHDIVLGCLEQRPGQSGHMLLVHARPEMVTSMIRVLESSGLQVHLACTPLQAVWILENRPDDIHTAIVARRLGRADGRDIVRFLSERHPRIRRILLSDAESVEEQESPGRAHEVLSGPFDPDGLKRVLPSSWQQPLTA